VNLEHIVDYLHQSGVGVKGKTLFAYSMPKQPNGILVLARSPISIHPYQKGRSDGTFQVAVRGTRYEEITAKADEVVSALTGEGLVMGTLHFLSVMPIHQPLIYPRSDGSMLEASVNFNFIVIQN